MPATTKERLRQIVEELDEEQAADAIHLLDGRYVPKQRVRRELPAWVGAGRTKGGETDVSARGREILRAELGQGEATHPC